MTERIRESEEQGVDFPIPVPKLCNKICLTAFGSSVLLAGLSAHSFSIKPVSHLMPSHCQLAPISPQMNIIPSVPMKQPSDAASVSADTMMNSYRQPPHRKELFCFKMFHNQEKGTILYTSSARSDTEFPLWSCCHYYRQYTMYRYLWISVYMSSVWCNIMSSTAVQLFRLHYFSLHTLLFIFMSQFFLQLMINLLISCKNNLQTVLINTYINALCHPMCLLLPCCSSRQSMNVCGTGSASPRHS